MTLNHYQSYQKHLITLLFENPEKWTPKAYIFKHFALKVTPVAHTLVILYNIYPRLSRKISGLLMSYHCAESRKLRPQR